MAWKATKVNILRKARRSQCHAFELSINYAVPQESLSKVSASLIYHDGIHSLLVELRKQSFSRQLVIKEGHWDTGSVSLFWCFSAKEGNVTGFECFGLGFFFFKLNTCTQFMVQSSSEWAIFCMCYYHIKNHSVLPMLGFP